jgi:hypothetical protein
MGSPTVTVTAETKLVASAYETIAAKQPIFSVYYPVGPVAGKYRVEPPFDAVILV